MDYDFSKFDNKKFEHLIQSLLQKRLGDTSIIFGEGADGARELTFEGEVDFPNSIERWKGYWVIQAKFKSRDFFKEDNYSWVKRNFKEDINKFKDTERNLRKPNNYLFYTNAILTPVYEKGGRDKIEKDKEEFKELIPNIFIGGYDEVCGLLDNNRDVRLTYSDFFLTGNIIADLWENKELYESYPKYAELKSNISDLKKELSNNLTEIKKLEREKKQLKSSIREVYQYFINIFDKEDNSKLVKKAQWLFLIEKDIDYALEILSEYRLERQESLNARERVVRAKLLFVKLSFEESERNFLKAIQISDNYETNRAYASFLRDTNKFEKSVLYYEKVYGFSNDDNRYEISNELGVVYTKMGEIEKAEKHYLETFKYVLEKYKNGNFPFATLAIPLMNIGNHFSRKNDIEKSEWIFTFFVNEMDKIEKVLPKDFVTSIKGNIGIFYLKTNKLDKAKEYLLLCVENIDFDDLNVANINHYSVFYQGLAETFALMGEVENAEKSYQNALFFLESLSSQIPEFFLTKFADLLVEVGRFYLDFFESPIEELNKGIEFLKGVENKHENMVDFQLGECFFQLSILQEEMGNLKSAKESLKSAERLIFNSEQKIDIRNKILVSIRDTLNKI